MLTDNELFQLCQQLGLSLTAQALIREIRSSPPNRRVRSAGGNVSVRYPSQKMNCVIQAESHKNELAGIYEMEHDADTLEYYDQPLPIKLEYQAKSGRSVGVIHTPDFFVIRTDGVGWDEWKMEEELARLADKMPHRYLQDEAGHWRCPPGERYAAQFGFFYRVRSSAEIDWIFQRNIRFLEDYLRPDCPEVSQEAAQKIISQVADRPGITLAELLQERDPLRSDELYTLIATERIYVDIRAEVLPEPERVHLFRDQQTAQAYALMSQSSAPTLVRATQAVHVEAGQLVVWDGQPWMIANLGDIMTSLLAQDGALVEFPNPTFIELIKQGKITGGQQQPQLGLSEEGRALLVRASPEDLKTANQRYQVIRSVLLKCPSDDCPIPARTVRDWLAKYRQAEQVYRCGYLGLLPRVWQRGNRQQKLPDSILSLMNEFIEEKYETLKQKSKREVYGELIQACEARGLLAPSYKSFARAINRRSRYQQTKKRQGRRAAYAYEPFYFELSLTTPRHGDRPFEIGHIDHTQLDIELICSATGRNLGRPWATFLVDAFSRRLLAVNLSFDPPSYRSCMMILRECVRRHSRLPDVIVVDNGGEFRSTYFETLLAHYQCLKKNRPAAKPRFGTVCERLFGTANTTFVHNLMGHTKLTRNVRQVTRSVNPKQHARWTLPRFYARLCEWAYDIYDTIDHPALGQSPREAFALGLAQGGRRPHRLIPFDETFQMLTLPTTARGTAKVQPNMGVKIKYIYYWSEAFRDPEVEKTQVPVRYDPFDAGIAYAFIKNRWVQCFSEHYACFSGRSRREVKLAAEELRRRKWRHTRQFTATARKLAEFLASVEAEEVLLEQRLRDAEGQQVLAMLEVGQSQPPTPFSHSHNSPDGLTVGDLAQPTASPEPLSIYGDF